MAASLKFLLVTVIVLVLLSNRAHAFGAGNIASLSTIEGKNWRHGDIEDMLKTVVFLKHHKWTSLMIKRVYFGNWLRDYSQAMDVGTLKGCPAATIRVLVWILAFMSFGYATAEFEVTDERLGVYRPEEHIDNPRDYADNEDARKYDPRLRPPVRPIELEVDPATGMKNYIANEQGDWATSLAYVKRSFTRSIEYGRKYASASGMFRKGNEADLSEALRCLGQGLHCLEDFGAHTNYVELSLREMDFVNVFPHVGTDTQILLGGKHVFPLVTGTFGGVDFLHSVIGEATDHVTQSEVSEVDRMNKALGQASSTERLGKSGAKEEASDLTDLLSKVPGTGDLCREAVQLQKASDAKANENNNNLQQPLASIPKEIDVQATVAKIYPILEFRDKVVRVISNVVSKIPGLESLIEMIQDKITLFIMGLLAPYIQPLITTASAQLKVGSTAVVNASGRHQYEPWTDPKCTDPTHSLLSKDHFSNILNEPAGHVASTVLQYCAPRVIYAWQHPDVPVVQVMADVAHVFHHPAQRQHGIEIQQKMFGAVSDWVHRQPNAHQDLNHLLSAQSVREGTNHKGGQNPHLQGAASGNPNIFGLGSHSTVSGSPFDMISGNSTTGTTGSFAGAGADAGPVPHVGGYPTSEYAAQTSIYELPSQTAYGQQPHANPPVYPSQDPPSYSAAYDSSIHPTFQRQEQHLTAYDSSLSRSGGFDGQAYPQQQQHQDYGTGVYPPQQSSGAWSTYPPASETFPQGDNEQQPASQHQDPNNPYPLHQQGFGGGGNYGGYGGS